MDGVHQRHPSKTSLSYRAGHPTAAPRGCGRTPPGRRAPRLPRHVASVGRAPAAGAVGGRVGRAREAAVRRAERVAHETPKQLLGPFAGLRAIRCTVRRSTWARPSSLAIAMWNENWPRSVEFWPKLAELELAGSPRSASGAPASNRAQFLAAAAQRAATRGRERHLEAHRGVTPPGTITLRPTLPWHVAEVNSPNIRARGLKAGPPTTVFLERHGSLIGAECRQADGVGGLGLLSLARLRALMSESAFPWGSCSAFRCHVLRSSPSLRHRKHFNF